MYLLVNFLLCSFDEKTDRNFIESKTSNFGLIVNSKNIVRISLFLET